MATYPPHLSSNWDTSLKAYVDQYINEVVSVETFGVIGDGVADDTAGLAAALTSGKALDWGGPGRVYRITGPLAITLNTDSVWVADGAKILLDSPSPIQRMVSITHAGYSLDLHGALHLDANRKAYQGLFCDNSTATLVNLTLQNLTVENVYRGGTTFTTGGDGIFIQGSFDHIKLIRPTVRNVSMAAGAAHNPGIQGITGITVKSASTTFYWRKVVIVGPLIDGIFSEDLTDLADQDGIRIMPAEDASGINIPYPSSFSVTDGEFRNCMGRAVKSQAEFGYIRNTQIYRNRTRYTDAAHTTPVRGGTDIDFQVGGGIVDGVYASYSNDAPVQVINLAGPATATKTVPHPRVTGIRVVTDPASTVTPQVLVQKGFRSETYSYTTIDDVESVGAQPDTMIIINGVAGGYHDVFLSRVIGSPTLANGQPGFIATRIDGWSGGRLYVDKMRNLGASPVRMIGSPTLNVNPNIEISARECSGFLTSQKALDQGRNVDGPIQRIDAYGPTGTLKSGVRRIAAQTVADGATWKLPASFLTNYTGQVTVSVDGDINGQGRFRCDQTQVLSDSAPSAFVVGTTSEPATGTYRLWSSSTGPSISNHSGASHTFTVEMFG